MRDAWQHTGLDGIVFEVCVPIPEIQTGRRIADHNFLHIAGDSGQLLHLLLQLLHAGLVSQALHYVAPIFGLTAKLQHLACKKKTTTNSQVTSAINVCFLCAVGSLRLTLHVWFQTGPFCLEPAILFMPTWVRFTLAQMINTLTFCHHPRKTQVSLTGNSSVGSVGVEVYLFPCWFYDNLLTRPERSLSFCPNMAGSGPIIQRGGETLKTGIREIRLMSMWKPAS